MPSRSSDPIPSSLVISGYGANLRTALQGNNLKMYDERTSWFDSPYQTGEVKNHFADDYVSEVLESKHDGWP